MPGCFENGRVRLHQIVAAGAPRQRTKTVLQSLRAADKRDKKIEMETGEEIALSPDTHSGVRTLHSHTSMKPSMDTRMHTHTHTDSSTYK